MFFQFLQTQNSNKSRSRTRNGEGSNQRKSHYYDHPSPDENHQSSHHNLYYYQNLPRQLRNKNNYGPKDSNVDLPSFYGNENVEGYWKIT